MLQISNLGRDGARELVEVHLEKLQGAEESYVGRYRANQEIVIEVQISERRCLIEGVRNCSFKQIVVQIKNFKHGK